MYTSPYFCIMTSVFPWKNSTLILLFFFCVHGFSQDILKPENLGEHINSEYEDLAPVITPDGKRMYFIRKHHPENTYGGYNTEDAWYADYSNETNSWGPAVHMDIKFNAHQVNGINSISPDGNTILVSGWWGEEGHNRIGFSLRHRTASGWTDPQRQEVPSLQEKVKGKYFGGILAPNGRVLISYYSEAYRGLSSDLYISFLQLDGTWSAPANIGDGLNTPYSEAAPFLASDNRTLYFASDRPGGEGGYDIYTSRRLDDTWLNWSEPINIGPPINTAGFDAYYSLDATGEYAYFSSASSGYGSSDVFRVQLKEELRPDPVVLLSGKVINKGDGTPVAAKIIFKELMNNSDAGLAQTQELDGKYTTTLALGSRYLVEVTADGYRMASAEINLEENTGYSEMIRDFLLEKGNDEREEMGMSRGDTPPLASIYFESDQVALKPEAISELNRLLTVMKKNPKAKVSVHGHTDEVGSEDYNTDLSVWRAKSVRAWLIARGIGPGRIEYEGFGNQYPVVIAAAENDRMQNRRVEIILLAQ